MEATETQALFFTHIKSKIPPNYSLVDEVAEVLNISNDSAYRRIRGEKTLSLDEVQLLCRKYHISIDQLLQLKSNTYIFTGNLVDSNSFGLDAYLGSIADTLAMFKAIDKAHLFYYNKDIPMFHHLQFPELGAFKSFFWKRTVMGYPELARQRFGEESVNYEAFKSGSKIIELYNQIPSTEIWNEENVHSTIRQIEFYRQSNIFSDTGILCKIYDQLEELLNHLELQAEAGKKFMLNQAPNAASASFDIYINEYLIGDNTIYVHGTDRQITNLNHNGLNFISSQDKVFCDYTYKNLQNIIRKSTHISLVGEKERSMFFHTLREKIRARKTGI